MAARLTVFVSSTVRDFGPVRRDLAEWLRGRLIDVRESEDPEFPVDPAVHSQDACLRAIEGCHLYILLVGWRYGGLYQGTSQSITWREYDEARRLGIPVIAFVLGDVSAEAARTARTGRPLGVLDPAIVRFVDAIRHERVDNWMHLEWDGSFTELRECVDARLNALFVAYQRPHLTLEREAKRLDQYAKARERLDDVAVEAFVTGSQDRRRLVERLLDLAVEYRQALFDFRDERYDFVVHAREEDRMRVYARRHHPSIEPHNRSWPIGAGHVGKAAERANALLVSPNLAHMANWRAEYPSDLENYRSAVCMAIGPGPDGVLTITSNRVDHFRHVAAVEVLTARSLARIIRFTGALDR